MSGMRLLAGRLCSSDCPPTFQLKYLAIALNMCLNPPNSFEINHSTTIEKTSEKFEVKGLLKT